MATPSLIERSRIVTPGGMLVYIAGDASSSAPFGPSSSTVSASRASALVSGTRRRTGTSPALSVNDPSMK